MKRNGHDEIGLIDEHTARLQHPAGQCFEPVAAAGPLEIEHGAPGRGIIDHGGAGAGPARRAGDAGRTGGAGAKIEAKRAAAGLADGAREEVNLAEFLGREWAFADTALAGNQ